MPLTLVTLSNNVTTKQEDGSCHKTSQETLKSACRHQQTISEGENVSPHICHPVGHGPHSDTIRQWPS